jgi:hypothetical protein
MVRMKDFAREPSRIERGVAIAITSLLATIFGSLFLLLAHLRNWLPSAIFAAAFLGALVLLHRAAFTARRALGFREVRTLAWCLLVFGAVVVLLVVFVDGSVTSRLLVLGPALTLVAVGGIGVRR